MLCISVEDRVSQTYGKLSFEWLALTGGCWMAFVDIGLHDGFAKLMEHGRIQAVWPFFSLRVRMWENVMW